LNDDQQLKVFANLGLSSILTLTVPSVAIDVTIASSGKRFECRGDSLWTQLGPVRLPTGLPPRSGLPPSKVRGWPPSIRGPRPASCHPRTQASLLPAPDWPPSMLRSSSLHGSSRPPARSKSAFLHERVLSVFLSGLAGLCPNPGRPFYRPMMSWPRGSALPLQGPGRPSRRKDAS
jgi:hypothetical protein